MLFISNLSENEIDFKNNFPNYEVVYIDLLGNEKKMKSLLIEAINTQNYFLYKKKIYVFNNSYLIPEYLITFIFKQEKEKIDNKDIYFLNIGENEKKFIKKGRIRYYKPKKPIEEKRRNFFKDISLVINLEKNRNKLIEYKKILPPMPYIFTMISYNICRSPNDSKTIQKNYETIINLRKFYKLKSFNKKILHAIINNCYFPLHVKRLDFPKKKEDEEDKSKIQDENIDIKDLREYISEDFINLLNKEEKTIRTSKSMF